MATQWDITTSGLDIGLSLKVRFFDRVRYFILSYFKFSTMSAVAKCALENNDFYFSCTSFSDSRYQDCQ